MMVRRIIDREIILGIYHALMLFVDNRPTSIFPVLIFFIALDTFFLSFEITPTLNLSIELKLLEEI